MALYDIFFGTYSKGADNGLFRGAFNSSYGEIDLISTLDIENPSYLQLNNSILYGVSELSSFNGENGGALFSVDIKAHEKMRLVDINATHGKHPCHLYIKENYIFVSNYSEGSLSIFYTDISGCIQPSFQSIYHFGSSVRKDRQESSHIHFAAVTPDDKFLAVCDLGMDKIFLYPYNAQNVISTNAEIIECPHGSGPRHLTFSACGKFMYVLTELSNTVLVYQYNKDGVRLLQEISTLSGDFKNSSTAAAIHLSVCGKYIAASNRGNDMNGADSIALYSIADNGRLELAEFIMTGKGPRDFRFSPCGNWLLSANQNDDSVTVYSINDSFKKTGVFNLPKPVCILFGEING